MRILLYGRNEDAEKDFLEQIKQSEVCRVKDDATFQNVIGEEFDYLVFHAKLFSGIKPYLAATVKIARSNCKISVGSISDFQCSEPATLFDFCYPLQKSRK